MSNAPADLDQIVFVNSFHDLVSTAFEGNINAVGWLRNLPGDFAEIVYKAAAEQNITVLDVETLAALQLTNAGNLAREVLLQDYHLLKTYGADPTINIIKYYERDDALAFFPTDVYSYHVDRSPLPGSTFLCTYYGTASDILPNEQAMQKILVPEIRAELKKLYDGPDDGFELFLTEQFYDLHYMPLPGAQPVNLGIGNLWRLAIDHPQSKVLPCVHRAPKEKDGEYRLLMIC